MSSNVNVLLRMCDYDGIISNVGDLESRITNVSVTINNGEEFEFDCNDSVVTHLSMDDGYDLDVKVNKLVEVLELDMSRDLASAVIIKLNNVRFRVIRHSWNILLSNELTNQVDRVFMDSEFKEVLDLIDENYIVYKKSVNLM